MAYLRAKGVQCYGIGPAIDVEDGPKGFGAHSDQEAHSSRTSCSGFVRFNYDVVLDLAEVANCAAFPLQRSLLHSRPLAHPCHVRIQLRISRGVDPVRRQPLGDGEQVPSATE
jgi:hypothetical protein